MYTLSFAFLALGEARCHVVRQSCRKAHVQIPYQLGIQKRTQVQPAASLSSHEAPETRGTWLDFTQIFDLQKMCENIHIFLSC